MITGVLGILSITYCGPGINALTQSTLYGNGAFVAAGIGIVGIALFCSKHKVGEKHFSSNREQPPSILREYQMGYIKRRTILPLILLLNSYLMVGINF